MFDERGIAWLYEPHTFVPERGSNGAVRQVFTPDFYLLDLDLYIECTVMRQTLTARKRQRVRKTREHEGVTVEILYGRDLQRLAGRWRWTGGFRQSAGSTSAGRLKRAL